MTAQPKEAALTLTPRSASSAEVVRHAWGVVGRHAWQLLELGRLRYAGCVSLLHRCCNSTSTTLSPRQGGGGAGHRVCAHGPGPAGAAGYVAGLERKGAERVSHRFRCGCAHITCSTSPHVHSALAMADTEFVAAKNGDAVALESAMFLLEALKGVRLQVAAPVVSMWLAALAVVLEDMGTLAGARGWEMRYRW